MSQWWNPIQYWYILHSVYSKNLNESYKITLFQLLCDYKWRNTQNLCDRICAYGLMLEIKTSFDKFCAVSAGSASVLSQYWIFKFLNSCNVKLSQQYTTHSYTFWCTYTMKENKTLACVTLANNTTRSTTILLFTHEWEQRHINIMLELHDKSTRN